MDNPLPANYFRRVYFHTPNPITGKRILVKRSTTAAEYCAEKDLAGAPAHGHVFSKESLENEALAMAYVKQHTTIPVPEVVAAYEDRGCFYLLQEFIEDAVQARVFFDNSTAFEIIRNQLEGYVAQLKTLTSPTLRSFTKLTQFPFHIHYNRPLLSRAKFKENVEPYVLCHGDLAWHNVLVHPETYKVLAIIDWEFAGFYPPVVEGSFWKEGTYKYATGEGPDEVVEKLNQLALKEEDVGGSESNEAESDTKPEMSMSDQDKTDQAAEEYLNMTGVAEDFGNLVHDMNEEFLALESWRTSFPTKGELHLQRLHLLLPKLHGTLFRAFNSSKQPLVDYHQALSDQIREINEIDERQKESTADWMEGFMRANDEKSALGRRLWDKKDEASVDFEERTWSALHEFASGLLKVSHAARSLLPHLLAQPDGDESPALVAATNRARHLIMGGNGGWQIQVVDLSITQVVEAINCQADIQSTDAE
ncbi:hypothetical protein P7C73_g3323, partial [Tremellales sp. Uapishka_1]